MLQIIYASAATEPFSPALLKTLLNRSRSRNSLYGVSGVLLYDNGSFVQVLEGPQSAVETIFRSIQKDPRHSQIKVHLTQEIARPEFFEWSMGFLNPSVAPADAQLDGLLDYRRDLPRLLAGDTGAIRLLRFFRDGLCRQRPK